MQLAETDPRNFRKVKRVEYSKWGWCEKKQDLVTMKECEDCGYHEAVFPEGPYVYSLCSWKPTEAPEEMCPLRKKEETFLQCIKEKCAWWIEIGCAIYHIAYLDIEALRRLVEGRR